MRAADVAQLPCGAHLLLFLTVAAISSAAAQQLPIAPGATTVVITPERGYFTEPAIAVDPRNPLHVLAAYQDNAHVGYSIDGGRHWAVRSVEPAPSPKREAVRSNSLPAAPTQAASFA